MQFLRLSAALHTVRDGRCAGQETRSGGRNLDRSRCLVPHRRGVLDAHPPEDPETGRSVERCFCILTRRLFMASPARKPAAERRRRSAKTGSAAQENQPKRSQRDRLLDAMIALTAQAGYQHVSIAQVSARAGVSRATFYEQFTDKEDCLLSAYRAAAERLLSQTSLSAGEDGDWSQAAGTALAALARALQHDPDAGRLLFVEMLAGGPRSKQTRRVVIGAFEERIQEFLDSAQSGAERMDIPAIGVVGALRSIVARYLRIHAEDELPMLTADGIAWVRSYAVPASRELWSTGPDALLPEAPEPPVLERAGSPPARLPRGRHGLPAGVIARSQRTRIINATAEVMASKGYENATVTDIVAAAGVSREVFYEHFSDKQNAFLEAQQHPTQHILDACASAYFAARDWPERIWNAFGTLLRLISENRAISHLRLVECYAAGPDAIRRAEEITRSFTIFLEEGYSYSPRAGSLPRLYSHAIAGAIFEIIQRHVAHEDYAGLVRRLPQLTYMALAPFTGPQEAVRLVSALKEGGSREDAAVRALR
jgi:AcrR family transcriptional regulator